MKAGIGLALFLTVCSGCRTQEQRTASSARAPSTSLPSTSASASQAAVASGLDLTLRADDLPGGGQRVVALLPELGLELPLAESKAPFLCQTTARALGSEPLLTKGARWLDLWCGGPSQARIGTEGQTLVLGQHRVPLPAQRYLAVASVPQIDLPKPCDGSQERVLVRLVVGGNHINLEIPKLGLAVPVEEADRTGAKQCQTVVLSKAARMELGCATYPGPPTTTWFQVSGGALVVEHVFVDFEFNQHTRWGAHLPCGQVELKGVDFRGSRYSSRANNACEGPCDEQTFSCSRRCRENFTDQQQTLTPEGEACNEACTKAQEACKARCGHE